MVFDSSGNYLRQFGTKCTSTPCPDGTFGATGGGHPHCVVLSGKDNLAVHSCDRPNSRIEVWDKLGNFVRTIHIGNAPSATAGAQAAILKENTRACDIDFWPYNDYLADKAPASQKYIIDVDLANDNAWIVDRKLGNIIGALGACGIAPCPGHNAGHFSFSHTTASDSQGNVYIAETITGRRVQKFVQVDGSDDRYCQSILSRDAETGEHLASGSRFSASGDTHDGSPRFPGVCSISWILVFCTRVHWLPLPVRAHDLPLHTVVNAFRQDGASPGPSCHSRAAGPPPRRVQFPLNGHIYDLRFRFRTGFGLGASRHRPRHRHSRKRSPACSRECRGPTGPAIGPFLRRV